MARELLTISRMESVTTCARKDYYRNELGLKPIEDKECFQFGHAWHAAQEARWAGKNKDEALQAAFATGDSLDELTVAKVSALLAGYYAYWGDYVGGGKTYPELEFRYPLERSLTFDVAGKIDCVVEAASTTLWEHKTTGMDICDTSQFWDRLKFNTQLYQYYLAAHHEGHDVHSVLYDVTRKPTIGLRQRIVDLDDHGMKIVNDADGNRVFKKNQEPRASEDKAKGYEFSTHAETCDEYFDRLYQDTLDRPEFYYARREIPILIQDLETFVDQRLEIGKQILYYRNRAKRVGVAGWPRNVKFWTCNTCEYSGFCLGGVPLNLDELPMGFRAGKLHEELGDGREKGGGETNNG